MPTTFSDSDVTREGGWLRRFVTRSPELVAALFAAALFAGLLEWRYLGDRAEFQAAATASDNAAQARLFVTRAYLIARSIGAGDRTYAPQDAEAALDRAQYAMNDWLEGRTTPIWARGVPLQDPQIRRLVLSFDDDLRNFRLLLRLTASDGGAVALRQAYSVLEARSDSISHRASELLREREREDRREHEATLFVLVLSIVLAGGWLERVARSARRAGERERRVQALTAALAVAQTPDEVAAAVAVHGIAAGEASHGSLGVITADGRHVDVIARAGARPQGFDLFATDADYPAAEAIRTGRPVFLESRDELCSRFPAIASSSDVVHICALAVVPLVSVPRDGAGSAGLGYISFSFTHERVFSAEDRRFLETIGEIAAQAMDRARSFVAEKEARAEAHRERERLFESESRLRDIAVRVPVGLYVALPSGEITWCNPQLGAILGVPVEEVLGHELLEFVVAEERDLASESRRLFHESHTSTQRFEFRAKQRVTGEIRQLLLEASAKRDVTGQIESTVGIVEDVTEERALEAQFAQAQKMEAVGRLAGGIAHDFNNLLTAMLAGTELLLDETPPADHRTAELREIREAVLRAAGLTKQLLAFSRRQVIQPRAVDVNALTQEAEKLLARVIGEDVTLELFLEPGLPMVQGDQGQLEQAMMNLVVNARDAMPAGGTIRISTRRVAPGEMPPGADPASVAAGYVELAVADTGTGMDPATKARIFDPFFTTKGVGEGTGLGLSMVYGYVTQIGGRVAVASEPGQGSTFHLYLPLASGEEGARGVPPVKGNAIPVAHAAGNETILVVDDDTGLRRATRRMLERGGYRVLEADGADAAIEVARAHPGRIDAIVTDVVMRGPGGRQLAEMVSTIRPEAAVAFMSGYTADVVLRQRVREGEPFLQKPFTSEQLTRFVRELIARRRAKGGEPLQP